MRRAYSRAKTWRVIDAAGPAVGGGLVAVLLITSIALWGAVGVYAFAALLGVAFAGVTLPEMVRARRWRRRRTIGCCPGCGADLRDVPWTSEGVYDTLRCPVCGGLFHTQQVRFPRRADRQKSPRAPE